MTTISVALTTYNGEAFLRQQLDSIRAQTLPPDELVVCDDQSTDGTWAMLTEFAAAAPFPVRLIRNAVRLGWRGNFMQAMSLCRCGLIALCDQDDVWHPEKLAIAAAALQAPDVVLFFHDAWMIDRAGARIGPAGIFSLPARNPPLSAHSFGSPFGFSMVFARSLLQFNDLWERSTDSNDRAERAPHDQWLFFLAAIFGVVVYSDRRLTDYRKHGGNAVGPVTQMAAPPASRQVWLGRMNDPAPHFRRMAGAARDRAAILATIQPRLDGAWHTRAVAGEQYCLRLASHLDRRAQLYERGPLIGRVGQFLRLYRDGTYRDANAWGFNRLAMLKDAMFGLLLRRFVFRSNQDAT